LNFDIWILLYGTLAQPAPIAIWVGRAAPNAFGDGRRYMLRKKI